MDYFSNTFMCMKMMIAQTFTGWKIMKDYEKNILIRDKNKQKDVWVWNNMIITNSILEWTLSLNPSSTWNHLSWKKKTLTHYPILLKNESDYGSKLHCKTDLMLILLHILCCIHLEYKNLKIFFKRTGSNTCKTHQTHWIEACVLSGNALN